MRMECQTGSSNGPRCSLKALECLSLFSIPINDFLIVTFHHYGVAASSLLSGLSLCPSLEGPQTRCSWSRELIWHRPRSNSSTCSRTRHVVFNFPFLPPLPLLTVLSLGFTPALCLFPRAAEASYLALCPRHANIPFLSLCPAFLSLPLIFLSFCFLSLLFSFPFLLSFSYYFHFLTFPLYLACLLPFSLITSHLISSIFYFSLSCFTSL